MTKFGSVMIGQDRCVHVYVCASVLPPTQASKLHITNQLNKLQINSIDNKST